MSEKYEEIVIHADPEIGSLMPGYIENRKKDIIRMQEALGKNDYETICYLGHSMKGSGGGYGFDAITEIGAALEKAAKHSNNEEIKNSIHELEVYLRRVKIVYEYL